MMTFPIYIYGKIKFHGSKPPSSLGDFILRHTVPSKDGMNVFRLRRMKPVDASSPSFTRWLLRKFDDTFTWFWPKKKAGSSGDVTQRVEFFTNRHDFQMSVWLWLWSNSSLVRNIGFNGFDLSSKIWVGRKKHTLSYLQEKYDTEVKLTCNNMQCDLCNTIMIQHENMPYLNKKLRRVNFQHLIGLVSLQHVPGFTDPRFTQPFANASCLHVISNG